MGRAKLGMLMASVAILLPLTMQTPEVVRADVAKPLGSLFVTLRDSISGKPLVAATTFVVRVTGSLTNKSGSARLDSIPAGRQVLMCHALAYHSKADTIEVRANRCDSLVVTLRRYKHVEADGDIVRVRD